MTRMSATDVELMSKRNRAAQGRIVCAYTEVAKPAPAPRESTPGKAGRTKYRSVSTVVEGGRFDSKLEARVWQDLKLREKAGEIRGLRRQVKFSLFMNGGEHYGVYKADFVYDEHGLVPNYAMAMWHRVCADAKSSHTRKLQAWQKVKKLMLACHSINVLELP